MKEYIVTFAQRFATNTHHMYPRAHPDGYVTLVAPDRTTARHLAFCRFGGSWAGLYDADSYSDCDELHPLGELGRFFALEEVSQ